MLAASPGVAEILFEPVDLPEHIYSGGWEHFVGGGLSAFDCDGDHLPELFAAGGAGSPVLLRNRSTIGGMIRFKAETPTALDVLGTIGSYPLDIDSDGYLDLVVLRTGENLLARGGPNCSFAPFETLQLAPDNRWTTAFSATWESGQDLPTLAFGNYVDRTNPDGPFRACDINLLYRPTGQAYGPPLPLTPGYCPLSMLFSDWGRNGRADLRISNDRHYYVDTGEEQMWAMSPLPYLFTTQEGWQSHKLWGMGIASRDLDHDGLPEVILTSMGDQRLQAMARGATGPRFRDVPYATGTSAHRPYLGGDGRPSTGWHASFGDIQNDGRDDVFIAKGNVEQMPDAAMDDPNNLLIQQADGTFVEHGGQAGVASLHRSRGATLVDLNGDGLLDLAVVNRRAAMQAYRNTSTNTGHWLSVSLHQNGANPLAVGAWIELDTGQNVITREITVGGGHAGGVAVPEHFGLGTLDAVTLRVIWPDGAVSNWTKTQADQRLKVQRADGELILSAY